MHSWAVDEHFYCFETELLLEHFLWRNYGFNRRSFKILKEKFSDKNVSVLSINYGEKKVLMETCYALYSYQVLLPTIIKLTRFSHKSPVTYFHGFVIAHRLRWSLHQHAKTFPNPWSFSFVLHDFCKTRGRTFPKLNIPHSTKTTQTKNT